MILCTVRAALSSFAPSFSASSPEGVVVGRTVSHYRILDRLGGGGMGVVYRAEDTRLRRQVALKFLPADLARDPHALDRFQREARAASALNHPHICTIHDIDDADGEPSIAMELLEGQTLKEHLQGRPLPTPEVVEVALQLDDLLAEAHAMMGALRAGAFDWKAAEREFSRSLELDPRSQDVLIWHDDYYLGPMKRLDDAVAA